MKNIYKLLSILIISIMDVLNMKSDVTTSDKQKLPTRIITGVTVLFLILAGSPFFNISMDNANAASNPYAPPGIFNLANSGPTSSDSYILWNTNVSSNNRVYYGINQADINNLINGSWSMWNNNSINVSIRISGLSANTTYYYKPESWASGIANDSVPANTLVTLKPGVWASPSEYMVSPAGWTGSPTNFRTVNISAAILNNNGSYVTNLSLQAIIYNSTGAEIGRTNLNGTGPYSGNYILPDYLNDGGYVIRITGYPNIGGEFSVMRWGCANCHTNNYPSTFNSTNVHPHHFDTTNITDLNVVHCGDDMCSFLVRYTSTQQCMNCHIARYPNWVVHPQSGQCSDCHRTPSGGNAALICDNCHSDITTTDNYLSPRYGQDRHYSKLVCSDCHGTLTSLTTKPNCATCHPRPGSILANTTIPNSIENTSHTANHTVACGLCHNREHDVKSLQTLDVTVCRSCHPGVTHDSGAQCTTCHGGDPHSVINPHKYYNTTQQCRVCHGNDTADTHHYLVASYKINPNTSQPFQCQDCHPVVWDNTTQSYSTQITRDCLVCHHF